MIRQTIPQYATLTFYSSLPKRAIRNKNVQIASSSCSIIMYIVIVHKVTMMLMMMMMIMMMMIYIRLGDLILNNVH